MRMMLLAVAALLAATSAAAAYCKPADFQIVGFSWRVEDACRRTPCPWIRAVGELRNNCSVPAGANVQLILRNASGGIYAVEGGWPASVSNIAPGANFPFDFRLSYSPAVKTISAAVVEARTWR